MATQAQFEANRRNARKSTGPKTVQGKQKSSQNAVKHGILARVIPEQTEGWQELLTGLYESLRPQDELQRFLVDQIAHSILRLQRAAYYEQRWLVPSQSIWLPPDGESIRRAYAKADGEHPTAFEPVVRMADYFASPPDMALLRYENACNRIIQKNLDRLTKLQSAARSAHKPACPYMVEEHALEGAAPSAPPSLRDDDQANAPQPGSPGLPAFQPGPSRPGVYTCNPPLTEYRSNQTPSLLQGEGRDEGGQSGLLTVTEAKLASFRNTNVVAGSLTPAGKGS